MQLATIGIESFKKYWGLIQAAMKGYKPIRQYEGFVLISGSKTHGLVFRIANETGGLRIAIGADEQPVTALVMADFEIAIETGEINKVLPYLGKGTLTIEDVPDKHGVVAFVTDKVTQHVPWLETVADQFPGDQFYRMEPRLKFNAHDLARRLRLSKSSATTNPKMRGHMSACVHIELHANDKDTLLIESATDARGVSRVEWTPDELWTDGQPFSYLLPIESIEVLARAASGYEGEVVVSGDIGGNMLAWSFGALTPIVRSAGEKFYAIGIMFEGKEFGSTSVPHEDFSNLLGLISAQTKADRAAKATVIMYEDKTVVTSPSTDSTTEGIIPSMGAGELPAQFTLNARQVGQILGDLRSKGLVHLSCQFVLNNRPILRITSPTDPAFTHVAILITNVQEPEVEVAKD